MHYTLVPILAIVGVLTVALIGAVNVWDYLKGAEP